MLMPASSDCMSRKLYAICHAVCRMPQAYARYALYVLYDVCRMLYAICAVCRMLYALCRKPYATCRMQCAVCRMQYAVCSKP